MAALCPFTRARAAQMLFDSLPHAPADRHAATDTRHAAFATPVKTVASGLELLHARMAPAWFRLDPARQEGLDPAPRSPCPAADLSSVNMFPRLCFDLLWRIVHLSVARLIRRCRVALLQLSHELE